MKEYVDAGVEVFILSGLPLLKEDLGLAFSDLHAALFAPHWDDIVTGKLSLEVTLKSVLPGIAPGLSPQFF
ncbi:hypothetical protein [Pseudomonas carnis]|uniref:hypothetical protein n=1 Tax=Pseudomonas carnis TaxID=2487355 RepID=UPI001DD4B680|nr:hypothetical protein [Pseudomonas carnis]CAH0270501.1 hypothetical protein SRABI08_03606 [Pseudomonas carnis]CAH0284604.1 hypothetical protein SRABI111_04062 [Pseudomonas carnis]CAH0304384.1 hypothetical protein SRABI110_04792 [Pseudomonas carnis]CAH0309023.1 hypothetical protein SRABI64_04707 [Pseudomonas carnis]